MPIDEAALATLVTNAVNGAVTPLKALVESQAATIATLQAGITANADAADEANRAVILAKKPGLAMVANSLKGAELAALAAEYQEAAPLAPGSMETNADNTALNSFNQYEGQ